MPQKSRKGPLVDWSPYFALYLGYAIAMLVSGIFFYVLAEGRSRILGARMILFALIWPIAAIAIIGWALARTPRILRDLITTARNKP